MTPPKLSERLIREFNSEKSFARGASYYRQGYVLGLERRGPLLLAAVEGTEETPYRVSVLLDRTPENSPYEADCTCPYDFGGWCKHIVAALLAYLEEPELAVVKPALETLLEPLSKAELLSALLHLLVMHPETIETLEAFLEDADTVR